MKILAILVLVLTGCTTAPVIMKHPATGKTAQCGPYDNRPLSSFAAAYREETCIRDYKDQGYVRQ